MNVFEYPSFIVLVLALAWPLGGYLERVFERRHTLLDGVLLPIERVLLRAFGVRHDEEMSAGAYARCFVLFGVAGSVLLFLILLLQRLLPFGPDDTALATPMTWDLAFNTALSFATTTTWQAYAGESTMRYLTQLIGLTAQNFLAGAAGLAVGIAFIRGFTRSRTSMLGNFWVDLVRALLWVLLPGALLGGVFLVWQGVPLNLDDYVGAKGLEGVAQTLPQGPVAALEFIKNLGTNGGGFFNANGAHPYENPTPLSNFVGMLAIVVLPAALPLTFGRMAGRPRAGWALLGVMMTLFVAGLALTHWSESRAPATFAEAGITGANLEGKETRFGVESSVLAAVVTSNAATGSYNSMHDSYRPAGVATLLINLLLGEIVFGGLGTGIYALVMFALVGLFMGGLMIGRTPDYLGKKIGPEEARLLALYALVTPLVVLTLTAIAVGVPAGLAGLTTNDGPHGFTEILFAYASTMGNNGQTMAGLSANTPFYNFTTSIAMAAGRFALTLLALRLAGRMAAQRNAAPSIGTLPDHGPMLTVLVIGTVILLGAVTYLPALALGPLAEALARP